MDMNNTPHHTPHHTHTDDCLGVNELNETTCAFLGNDDRDALRDACRRTVTFTPAVLSRLTHLDVHTFTNTDDDAIALARATRPEYADVTARISFTDTDHVLDEYAHPGFIRDVPNPE